MSAIDPELKTDPALLDKIEQSARAPITPEQLREQRVSWAWGQMSHSSEFTMEDVRRILGDIRA